MTKKFNASVYNDPNGEEVLMMYYHPSKEECIRFCDDSYSLCYSNCFSSSNPGSCKTECKETYNTCIIKEKCEDYKPYNIVELNDAAI